MVRHLIIWNVKEDATAAQMADAKQALEALMGVIDGLVSISVHIKPLSSSTAQMALDSAFINEAALKAYATDPRHLAAAAYVRAISVSRACFDYEYEG